jgi:hypothetical protein
VKPQLVIRRGRELRLPRGNDLEPRGNFRGIEFALGELQVGFEVARLGTLELRVQLAHRHRQMFREQPEPFAGARLDERVHDHEIELAIGLVRAHQLAQLAGISAGLHAPVVDVELSHEPLDLLEVLELFARQARQRHGERAIFRIGKDQRHRRRCGLFFAIGVVDEQRRQVSQRGFDPGARRRGLEDVLPGRACVSGRGGGFAAFAHEVGVVLSGAAGMSCDDASIGMGLVAVAEGGGMAASASAMSRAAAVASAGRSAASFAMSVSITGCSTASRSGSFGIGALA